MNYSNIIIFLAAFTVSVLFLGSVFINVEIRRNKNEVMSIMEEINLINNQIKRQNIEISALTCPHNVYDYVKKNNLISVPVNKIKKIEILNDNSNFDLEKNIN